jgi:sugar transferase (PEP-CTERM system associated)
MSKLLMRRLTVRSMTLVAFETVLLLAAVTMSAYLRFRGGPEWAIDDRQMLARGLLIALVCQICLYYNDLYDRWMARDRWDLFERLLQALGATSLILAALYFWFPTLIIGRGVFGLAAGFVIVTVVGWRIAFAWMTRRVAPRERLLLVGTNAAAVALARELYERQELGVDIVGFIDPDPAKVGTPLFNPAVIGTIEDIPAIVRARAVDRVVVSLADARGKLPMGQLLEMKMTGVTFDHLASLYEEYTGKIALENLRPSWLIFSTGFRNSRRFVATKRALDLIGSLVGIILAAPVLLLVSAVVKLTSAGPVLFHQQRVGRNGRVFTVHKIRSMRINAEAATGPVWSTENDDRITTIGRFLRRTRVDELPQLWNVLKGDMSLVGPRPERPEFVKDLARAIPFYGERHAVRPGLTGWAQVRYTYGASVEDAMEKLQYDLYYIKNASIALDLFILLATAKTVVLRRGA